ncbi:hypothetical protein AURDEDRAFT_167691 [Auricularia subglabra TFB-10046 SS5]|nr:hypothetical protein AURDEDRAFT_167691 [Auricularia subglabra TFB-10046 SS5]
MHELADLTICSPDEDGIYDALEPLISFFDLVLTQTWPVEFLLTVKSRHTPRVRRFAEPLRYYRPGSPYANELLANEGFMEQLASFQIDVSLWKQLRPWLVPTMTLLPKLILVLNEDTPFVVSLPLEPLSCPALGTLVIQAKCHHAYVSAEDLIAFADRLTAERIKLELQRVLVDGSRELLDARFASVEYSQSRYPAD